jgi:uncharacterized protein (DUF1697 family)
MVSNAAERAGMSKSIALLRAVNVGGTARILSSDLTTFFAGLGFLDAATLLQSGNVVFTSQKVASAALEQRLREEAKSRLKLDTDFLVRTAKEWRRIVDDNPFPHEATSDPARLHVMALTGEPKRASVQALQNAIVGAECMVARGRQLYIHYPDGAGGSKLQPALITRHLGVRGTARNWNTTLKLLALVEG